MNYLNIKNLTTTFDKKNALNNISFQAKEGDVIAILGPNGSGKSTLLKAIMHHFSVNIKNGSIEFKNKNITKWPTNKIAKLGIFYSAQNPIELEGIQLLEFFKIIASENTSKKAGFYQLYTKINQLLKSLDLPNELLTRNVNVGFSGGQKKKNEILQAQLFQPSIILLDEIDSGLDFDAIKIIANFINKNRSKRITIIVSHHLEFLQTVKPTKVILLINGQIIKTGAISLAKEIEKNGFKKYLPTNKKETDFEITDPYLSCQRQ